MDLRSGQTYWDQVSRNTSLPPSTPAVQRCEVVIIGGGITGALVAFHLLREGIDTVLIDRRPVAHGSTVASTGLLQYEIDTPLIELIRKRGESQAVQAYRRGLHAIDEIEEVVEQLPDRCEFQRRDSLYFASHWWHARRLRREYDCRKQFGFEVQYWDRRRVRRESSLPTVGAIHSRGDAQINPYAFTLALLKSAVDRGLKIRSPLQVVDVEERAEEVLVRTEAGTVQCRAVVYATGYETKPHVQQSSSLDSTYATVSQTNLVVPGWPNESLIWETARPYFYARRTADGRAMIGGEDTEFANDHDRDALVEKKIARLVRRFEQLFPGTDFQPAYSWAGTFASTKDGLAYIGRPPDRPRAYFALGYGGNGITFSMIAAKLITDLYCGRPNPDAEVFRFGR